MPLTFKHGRILHCGADILVNPVNPDGVKGAGLALAYWSKFPNLFKAYAAACYRDELEPGGVHFWSPEDGNGPTIANVPVKRHWRGRADLTLVRLGVEALTKYLRAHPSLSMALPALGCGLGGLDFRSVEALYVEHLGPLPNKITCFHDRLSRLRQRS